MTKPIAIIDSYPRLAETESVRYCALVSRDRDNPRRRTALGGRGQQFLELRGSKAVGTITTVHKVPIKREQSKARFQTAEREELRPTGQGHPAVGGS